jgi:hypothetical protein
MKAVKWNPETLIADRDIPVYDIADWASAARRGERVRVEIRPSGTRWDLEQACGLGTQALFREGCIKIAEARLWLHPQKGRVLAEIHRRFDLMPDAECGSDAWYARMASIYDYAGAWALAVRLMQIGLRVRVLECRASNSVLGDDSADVEIVLLAGDR